jgi:hypothetical protein
MGDACIDAVRGAHLLCLALGMGSALYLDFRTLAGLNRVIEEHDILEMRRIHHFVSAALVCLWVTGLMLIWIRTSFDISQFSPKLWCKLAVVSAMTLNAWLIGTSVMPIMEQQTGERLIDLPPRQLLPMVVIGAMSMFCWIAALALGSSKVLKTAPWHNLLMGLSLAYVGIILGGVAVFFWLRASVLRPRRRRDPFDRLLERASER